MRSCIFILLVLIGNLFWISCAIEKPDDQDRYTQIIIDNSNIEDSKDVSGLIDNVQLIQLKEKKGNFIGGIFKLYIVNGRYIVYDRINTNKINLFDSSGTLIKTIIKVGDGPDDALNITDCWLNNNNELEVYDYAQMKIFRFDTVFNPAGSIKAKYFYHFTSLKQLPASDKYVAYTTFNEYNPPFKGRLYHFALLNKDLNIEVTDQYFKKTFQGITWLQCNEHFMRVGDTMRFIRAYDNYIYNAGNTGLEKRYKIIYKKKALPDDVLPIVKNHLRVFKDMAVNPNDKVASLKPYARLDGKWLETKSHAYIWSRDGEGKYGNRFFSLIDKRTNNVLFNARELHEKQKYRLVLPSFEFYDAKEDVFIGLMNGEWLNRLLYKDSEFRKALTGDPETIYVLKVKFKL